MALFVVVVVVVDEREEGVGSAKEGEDDMV